MYLTDCNYNSRINHHFGPEETTGHTCLPNASSITSPMPFHVHYSITTPGSFVNYSLPLYPRLPYSQVYSFQPITVNTNKPPPSLIYLFRLMQLFPINDWRVRVAVARHSSNFLDTSFMRLHSLSRCHDISSRTLDPRNQICAAGTIRHSCPHTSDDNRWGAGPPTRAPWSVDSSIAIAVQP